MSRCWARRWTAWWWARSSPPSRIPMPTACRSARSRRASMRRCTIVCGAPNARVGLKAPLATVGAVLPGGIKIKKAKLRGVESSGMLCSGRELGVDADASGLMELPADAPTGAPLAEVLGLPDASIEIGLTPNRPDCLGMWGLARDVAAQFDGRLHIDKPREVPVEGTGPARSAPGGRRRLPALPGPYRRGHRPGRADAAVDGRAPAPSRPAPDQRGGRRDQLRDAGNRPAAARLRQRHAAGRHRGAPRRSRARNWPCSTAARSS